MIQRGLAMKRDLIVVCGIEVFYEKGDNEIDVLLYLPDDHSNPEYPEHGGLAIEVLLN